MIKKINAKNIKNANKKVSKKSKNDKKQIFKRV
jgi:hypothetical protein